MTTDAKSPNHGPKPSNSDPHSSTPAAAKAAGEGRSAPATPLASNSALSALANPKVLTTIVAVAIVANIVAFYFFRLRKPAPPPAKRNLEMLLGQFEYARMNPRDKQLKHGQFVVKLHLAATLDNLEFREAHDRDKEMQSAIEETMRHLRASDYADPRFTRLRHKLQEALNEQLGFEGVDEVDVASVPDQPAPETASADGQGSTGDTAGQAGQEQQQAGASQESSQAGSGDTAPANGR